MDTTPDQAPTLWAEGGRPDLRQSSARQLWQALVRLVGLGTRTDPKVQLLRRVYLFAGCTERELRLLATQADEVQVRSGTVLTTEGRRPNTFFMLLEGLVRVQTEGRADVQYGPGAAFDVVAMAERGPASATVTTDGRVRMLVMSLAQFRAVAGLPRLQDALWRTTSPLGVAPPVSAPLPESSAYRRPRSSTTSGQTTSSPGR